MNEIKATYYQTKFLNSLNLSGQRSIITKAQVAASVWP